VQYRFEPEDQQMLRQFIEEATEYLQRVEEETLRLETIANPSEALDEIFRNIHTIKSLSSFFSLTEITTLSHQLEYVLDDIRSKGLKPSPAIVGALLDAKDLLSKAVAQLRSACDTIQPNTVLEISLEGSEQIEALTRFIQSVLQESSPALSNTTAVISQTLETTEKFSSNKMDDASKRLIEDFIFETDENVTEITNRLLINLDCNPDDQDCLLELFRRIHTLKGNAALLLSTALPASLKVIFNNLVHMFQQLEDMLVEIRDTKITVTSSVTNVCFQTMDEVIRVVAMLKSGQVAASTYCSLNPNPEENNTEPIPAKTVNSGMDTRSSSPATGGASNMSIRVNGEKLERLMNMIGELAITKDIFSQIARKLMLEYNLGNLSREVKDAGQIISRITAELEDSIMSIRMTEIRMVFQKFPRVVRDIALQRQKDISLIMEGEETEIDKSITEQISDPLLHLVRNAADHGIETIVEREKCGKETQGKIWLRAYSSGKSVVIEIEDNGRGMDTAVLKRKAIEKGFISSADAEQMSEEAALQLVFLPGFSTAQAVSEISGRGVGMDVVSSNIHQLRGQIKIDSKVGCGSKITIQLPLTLMVSKGLLVETSSQLFVIPLDNVVETLKIANTCIVNYKGKRMLHHRDEIVGVVCLSEVLGLTNRGEIEEHVSVVVVTDGQVKIGVVVEKLLNEQDIVIKPLPTHLVANSNLGGATILGNGKVALVMNIVEFIKGVLD